MSGESDPTALPVNLLRPGLYVHALDRPWVETPFLFQGFRIATEQELRALRAYCRRVFVDLGRSDTAAAESVLADLGPHNAVTVDQLGGRSEPGPAPSPRPAPPSVLFEPVPHPERESFARVVRAGHRARQRAREAANQAFRSAFLGRAVDVAATRRAVADVADRVLGDPSAMLWLTYLRRHEAYAASHAVNACVLALVLGAELGMGDEALHRLGLGTLLMDVGKVRLPRELLARRGPLTANEFERVKRHVEYGCELLTKSGDVASEVVDIVRMHHERRNGRGYPLGAGGDGIPRQALIAGIADSYDAMTSWRPYRDAIRPDRALQELYTEAEGTFGADLVEAFIRAMGSFPVGSVVELDHGETAVVVGSRPGTGIWPTVLLLRTPDGRSYRQRLLLNLAEAGRPGARVPARHIRRTLEPRRADVDVSKLAAVEFGVQMG